MMNKSDIVFDTQKSPDKYKKVMENIRKYKLSGDKRAKDGTEIERENPLFEGQSAEEFIERWNAVTKAIKMRAEMAEHEKAVSYDVIR